MEKPKMPSAEEIQKSIVDRQVKPKSSIELNAPKYEEAIKKIKEIKTDVENNWTANDGGLTMAASDVLSLANSLEKEIEKGERPDWVDDEEDARFNTDTGTESDLYDIAYEYWNSQK
ncbi:hypothetical protein KAJ61_00095 [Candidatus Parcubacteria bacterium]|nr:hypothetical protein [Candidatus Parcubacteria bacterium]